MDHSDDLYTRLKTALFERVHDKESMVRMQAVVALAKLQTNADGDDEKEKDDDSSSSSLSEEEDDSSEERVADVLVDVMTHDSAACVESPSRLFKKNPFSLTSI